ncbi:MAG: 6,7-dimethyl-8-ribityllumazine synthase [Rhodobacteraceae bacterium]|nr:6,7-dimethyl-8-ribityllumazine synthase [Paracoccaceae bacterium]
MAVEHDNLPAPVFEVPVRVLLVLSPYYRGIAAELVEGARAAVNAAGGQHETIEVPGALEIPTAIKLAANHFDAFVALGCVVRGETSHYETVCNDSSRALALLGLEGLCIGNGILTVENMAQAEVRAKVSELNKGGGAAQAALHLLMLKQRFTKRVKGGISPSSEHILMAGKPDKGII